MYNVINLCIQCMYHLGQLVFRIVIMLHVNLNAANGNHNVV